MNLYDPLYVWPGEKPKIHDVYAAGGNVWEYDTTGRSDSFLV